MSLRALWSSDGGVPDLRYRVIRVRVWGTMMQFGGIQFFYRHYFNGEEREGQPSMTSSWSITTPPLLEIDLMDEEFIVAVGELKDITGESPISGIALLTSTGRSFQVGSYTAQTLAPPDTPACEVHGLCLDLTPTHDAAMSITPTLALFPTVKSMSAKVEEVCEAVKMKWWYPERCDQLAAKLTQVNKMMQGVIACGVVHPVGLLAEFAELASLSKAVVESCGQPLSVEYVIPRGLVIDGYVDRLTVIETRIKERIPDAELKTLEAGNAVTPLSDESVPTMVRQALKRNRPLAVELGCKYADYLASDGEYVHRMIDALLETDENSRIADVVRAHARVTNAPVATIMSRHKMRQPPLIDRAVHWGKPALFEWLITEAGLDPFDSPSPIAPEASIAVPNNGPLLTHVEHEAGGNGTLTHVAHAAGNYVERQIRYENLMEAAESTEDKNDQLRIQTLLSYIKKKDDFQMGLVALATEDAVVARQFQELVPKITSVYDLPLLFSQAKTHLYNDESGFSGLIKTACDHIIGNRLVLDTKASAFFNIALRQASERGHLTPLEHEHYRIVNSQINMESAAWVVELKRATDQIQWRLSRLDDQLESLQRNVRNLRDSIRRNEEVEMNRRRCRRNLALLSTMLSMVGGQAVFALQDMFVPVDPVLLTASEDDLMAAFKDTARGLLAQGSSSSLLEHSATSFRMLQSEPEAEPDGFMGLDVVRSLGVESEKALEVIDALTAAAELCRLKTLVEVKRVTCDERQIWLHPYHNAVRQSHGDLQQFRSLESALRGNADVNDEFEITVTKVHSDGATTTTSGPMAAYIYASHLGFLEIVDHFLANRNLRKREWKMTTRRRARKAQSTTTRSGSQRLSR